MKKIQVLLKPQCNAEIQNQFATKFGDQCEFTFQGKETEDAIAAAEVVIGEPEEAEILKAENLRWIQLTWAGADKYTKMKAFPTGVTLTNASGAFGKIISEYVIGNIIALYRELPNYWKNKQKHLWVQNRSSETIYGKNILILGTGDIGRNIAHRMKAFETHVTGIKRTAVPEHLQQMKEFDEVYDLTALDQQLQKADIVIGCLPGTPETKGLLNYERLYSMKKDAILVNVGRGSLIPTEDLIRVLEEGHLKGAVLDVFETEPLPETSPLWNMENVLITPHIAGPSFGGNAEVQDMIWNICMENMERYLNGKKLKNIKKMRSNARKKYFYFIIIGDFFKSALPIRCVGMGLHSIAIFVARTSRLNCGLCSLKSAVFVIIGTLQVSFACFKIVIPTLFIPRIRIYCGIGEYISFVKPIKAEIIIRLILLVVYRLFFTFSTRVSKLYDIFALLKILFSIPSVTSLIFCKSSAVIRRNFEMIALSKFDMSYGMSQLISSNLYGIKSFIFSLFLFISRSFVALAIF